MRSVRAAVRASPRRAGATSRRAARRAAVSRASSASAQGAPRSAARRLDQGSCCTAAVHAAAASPITRRLRADYRRSRRTLAASHHTCPLSPTPPRAAARTPLADRSPPRGAHQRRDQHAATAAARGRDRATSRNAYHSTSTVKYWTMLTSGPPTRECRV